MRNTGVLYALDRDAFNLRFLVDIGNSLGLATKTFHSLEEFLNHYSPSAPSCLVTEIRLQGTESVDLQQRLRAGQLRVPVIFLTEYADVESAVEAMKSGAFDFIQKPCGAQKLANRISQALARDREQLQCREGQAVTKQRLSALTSRERQVVELFSLGKETKQIARQLSISAKTVDFHRGNAYRKLGVSNVAELVRLFLLSQSLVPK